MHDLHDVSAEAVANGSLGDLSSSDRPTGDLRLARPQRLRALDGVDGRAVQRKPRISMRSAPFREFGIEPNTSSPSSKAASIPEIRGDPSARKVAIVLCL